MDELPVDCLAGSNSRCRSPLDFITWCLVACQCLSLLSSIWLWCRCQGAGCLLARQMRQLALADGILAIAVVGFLLGTWLAPLSYLHRACIWERSVHHNFVFASILFELHIACGVTAAALHRTAMLDVLGRFLRYVWPAAFLLAAVDAITMTMNERPCEKVHFIVCQGENPFTPPFVGFSLVSGLFIYLVGAVRSCQLWGVAALRRTTWGAVLFPLSFFVSFGPNTYLFCWTHKPLVHLEIAGWFALSLNGFLNALCYSSFRSWRHNTNHMVGFQIHPSVHSGILASHASTATRQSASAESDSV